MSSFLWFTKRFCLFLASFCLEIYFVDAGTKPLFFADRPEKCSEYETFPCAVSSGDRPFYFYWGDSRWEIAKHTVVSGQSGHRWQVATGHFVLKAQEKHVLLTPFAEIHLQNSGIFVQIDETRLTVSVLSGDLVKIIPRGGEGEQVLAPGFMNWYGGIGPRGQDIGVPTVMNLTEYATQRAHFFTDHKVGFVNELKLLAGIIQRATEIAAKMHRDLVERKMAMLQADFDGQVERRKKRVDFNRYLRMLFRRKINYDY